MNDKDLINRLHDLGAGDTGAPAYLASRVMANLPAREPLQQIFAWFTDTLWKSTAVVATPLILGFTLGISGVLDNSTDDSSEYHGDYLVYADMLEDYSYDEF